MIHFCFLTGIYSRQDPLMFYRQGFSLEKEGFKVTYIVCDGLGNEVKNGINIVSSDYVPKSRLNRFLFSKKHILEKAVEIDADVYQFSDPELIDLIRPLKKKKKKVIFNLREYYPDLVLNKQYIPRIIRSAISYYYSKLMEYYLPKYDAVFTVTPQLVDLLKHKHGIKNSFLLTNYPVPNLEYSLSKEEYIRRPNVLLYEGSIYAVSRQEKVFDALSSISNVSYLLAGKIENGYEIIKEHNYWNSVDFIDGFSPEQLKDYFKRATISNSLRDFEGKDGSLGILKIFESMEAAIPVLLSDVPVYKEMVEKYHCGICVNPNDSNDIKSAIEFLINHKEMAYEMGQNGRAAVLKEFNWNIQARNYIEIIRNL